MEEKKEGKHRDKLEEFRYWNTFGVEKWYRQLVGATEEERSRPCTFRSSFLAISIEEAQAFVEYQELLPSTLMTRSHLLSNTRCL